MRTAAVPGHPFENCRQRLTRAAETCTTSWNYKSAGLVNPTKSLPRRQKLVGFIEQATSNPTIYSSPAIISRNWREAVPKSYETDQNP